MSEYVPTAVKKAKDNNSTAISGTGFIEPLYLDGHQGIPNWSEEELTEITRKANAHGVTMHIHALGNAGINRVVNAYINGGKDEMRNTLVHVFFRRTESFLHVKKYH